MTGVGSLLRSPLIRVGLGILSFLVVVAAFAPLLTVHDPQTISAAALQRPSDRHWLGTDVPGRDIFAQLVYGTRASLLVAFVGATLAVSAALVIGALPALLGGIVDRLANRVVVFLLALPGLPLVVLIGALAGRSQLVMILVIGALGAAPNARILRGQVLTLRRRGFVASSQGFGGGPLYVLRRHIVPGLAPLLAVGFVNWAAVAIGLEAALALLGLGDPSGVSWGLMLNRALTEPGIYFSALWTWWVLPAGLAIAVSVVSFTFIGVGLEPSFNPRWLRTA